MSCRECLAIVLVLAVGVAASAGELEPREGEERDRQHEMEEMAEEAILGHVRGEELAKVERYWTTHLRRPPMDAIASAHCAIAEIQLNRRNPRGAVAALEKLLAGKPDEELRNVTHLNLAEIHRRHLNDAAGAAKHYGQVRGVYRHLARHYLLAMLVAGGKAAEAAKHLEGLVAKAHEKGEKLALLHRLASLYRRLEMPDQALKTYERITREFTAADLKQLREDAANEAEAMIERMQELFEADRGEEGERLERKIHRRARDLRLAGRQDEAQAFRAVMDRRFRELEEEERKEREREGPREKREEPGERGAKPGEF